MPRTIMTVFLVAAAIALSGCNSPTPNVPNQPATPPSSVKQTENDVKAYVPDQEANKAPSAGDSSAGQSASTGQSKQDEKDGRFVPERVFQLNKLQKATCKVGKNTFHLWVMDTDAKRQEGMMHLKNSDFKDDDGMVFVFMREDYRRFWMHNTLVDLDVAYCDKDGKIINVFTMKALDETTDYSSTGPAMYVIELRAGILKKQGIKAGMKWSIPETVVSKDDGQD